jgi:hypothetical protein
VRFGEPCSDSVLPIDLESKVLFKRELAFLREGCFGLNGHLGSSHESENE